MPPGFGSIDRFKNGFFDRPAVARLNALNARRTLSRFGAFVRQRAKSSIRSRKKVSTPGSPPSSHAGILKRFVYFAYDAGRQSVVVGPAKTNQVFFDRDRRPVRGTVPEVLEYGGAVTLLEVFKFGRWQRADLRSKRRNAGLPTRYRTAAVAARPYMRPAFEAELAAGRYLQPPRAA